MSDTGATRRPTRKQGWLRRAIGHVRTVAPTLRQKVAPPTPPPAELWRATVANDRGDDIVYTGLLSEQGRRETLVVLLHGLGGDVERGYCVAAASAARRAGLACLRLPLRGADGTGKDLYHAGFTDDLAPLLSTSPIDEYERIVLVGYSLGGHVALRAAIDGVEDRLAAVATVCAPLDLKATQQAIDAPEAWLYRRYLLRGLKESYPSIARGGPAPTPVDRVDAVTTLREWDSLTVVPRFGFRDVDDYYASQSAGPRLGEITIPVLFVASPADPIVPADSLRGALSRAGRRTTVRWVRGGGHVFFPRTANLGLGPNDGVEHQIMGWIGQSTS